MQNLVTLHVNRPTTVRTNSARTPAIETRDQTQLMRLISATLDFRISQSPLDFDSSSHILLTELLTSCFTRQYPLQRPSSITSEWAWNRGFTVVPGVFFFFFFFLSTRSQREMIFVFYERGILYVGASLSSDVSLHDPPGQRTVFQS